MKFANSLSEEICIVNDISTHFTDRNLEYQILTVEVLQYFEKKEKFERSGIIAKRCLWKEREVKLYDRQTNRIYDHKYSSDGFYNILKKSQEILVTIGIIQTTPYYLDDVIHETFNTIVYDEKDYLKEVAKQLSYFQINAKPLDREGKPYDFKSSNIEVDKNGIQICY